MSVVIELTPDDITLAHAEARRRQQYNEARNMRGRNRAPEAGAKALRLHELGCVGELVVAKYLGLEGAVFAAQGPVRGSSDLPGGIEVKTRPRTNYELLVQLDDDPNKIFVLVTYEGGHSAHIRGWIRGRDAMRKEWIREFVRGRPCYAVSQKVLQPVETLLTAMHGNAAERVLEGHEAWVSEQDGEMVLHFSPAVADSLGWQVGTSLEWSIVSESTCVVRPAREQPANQSRDDTRRAR